jgi:hypothetical protein
MKYLIWGIVGLVLVVVGVVGYGTYWHKYDFSDPQVAAGFKEKYNDNCMALYKQRAAKSGKSVDEAQLAKLEQACSCVRDGVVDLLAKRGPTTGIEVADLMQNDPEMKAVSKSCSEKFGIEEPL